MGRVTSLRAAAALVRRARARGLRVALANGVFDVLHVGHVRYLAEAKRLAGFLVVAANSDASARALKGAGRPLVPARERAEVLSALSSVDLVVTFPQRDVRAVIRALRPDFHAKGTDYRVDTVPERDEVEACGGRVVIAGDPKGHSSSALIRRMRRGQGVAQRKRGGARRGRGRR